MSNIPQTKIELAHVEAKLWNATAALLETEQALQAVLDREGLPFKDVQDRLIQVRLALHELSRVRSEGETASGAVRPLETAPRDERDVVLICRDGQAVVACWVPARDPEPFPNFPTDCWKALDQSGSVNLITDAIGWIPQRYGQL